MKTQETRCLQRSLLRGIFLYFLWVGTVSASAVESFALPDALAPSDDDSSPAVNIGFPINFFGTTFTQIFVNNNGNVTLDAPLSTFTPFGLAGTRQVIIAPFFADVDTRAPNSGIVRFGNPAERPDLFVVDWVQVGYFNQHDDKLNRFQLILQDLSAVPGNSPGDFRILFNYDRILWETGDASGGMNGLGGDSARAGFSNGTGQPGSFFELPGSGVNGALLDSGVKNSLVGHRLPETDLSLPLGRYEFTVRNGAVEQADLGIATEVSVRRDTVKFDLVVRNFSKSKARNVVVVGDPTKQTADLPPDISRISRPCVVTESDLFTFPDEFRCEFPVIEPGEIRKIRVVVSKFNLRSLFTTVGSSTFDKDLSNNQAEATLDPENCGKQVLSRSAPESVLYEPTATEPATKTLKLAIINAGKDRVKIRGIEPLPLEDEPPPFGIIRIRPPLPVTIQPGDGKVFRVETLRASGLPAAPVQPPYFRIQFECKKKRR